jgi:hypothetical protein
MSTKKTAKSKVSPKRMRPVPAERKTAVAARDAMTETPNGNFWTLRLEPMEIYVVGDNIGMSLMVIKNPGPGVAGVCAGYGDHKDLAPGKFRVTTAYSKVTIESKEEKFALVEMQFLPAPG